MRRAPNGPRELERLLAELFGTEEDALVPRAETWPGEGLYGRPTGHTLRVVLGHGGPLPERHLVVMSVPGLGIFGTGAPPHGVGGALDGGELVSRAMRAAMEQAVRVVVERSMEDQGAAATAPPANESLRDALPRVVVTKEDMVDSSNSKCAVCLEEHKTGARATRMLCGHLFCTSCIREWLGAANSCPVCRFELATDRTDYEEGRRQRMRGRKVRLKGGELRMMRVPELKRLMRALGVPGEGCVEKADLIKRLGEVPTIEIASDRNDVFYEESELRDLELPMLRSLVERHCLPKLPEDISEAQEREETLERFAAAGWIATKGVLAAQGSDSEPGEAEGSPAVAAAASAEPSSLPEPQPRAPQTRRLPLPRLPMRPRLPGASMFRHLHLLPGRRSQQESAG